MLSIRKATLNDLEFLLPLMKELMAHNRQLAENDKTRYELLEPVPNIESMRRKWVAKWIKASNGLVLIAEVNNEIVGYSLNYIKEDIGVYLIRKLGYINDIYIKAEYRSNGIAGKLKELAFQWFGRKRIRYIAIGVHAKNKKAHGIYKKWGFFDYHIEMRKKL